MRNLIIASTSTIYGSSYLDYIMPQLQDLYKNCTTILFIPFAQPLGISYNEYTAKVAQAFAKINKKVEGIHTFLDMPTAIAQAQAIFVGGGNTFLLVQQLYATHTLQPLQNAINQGTPYLGTSAGSNITGVSMQTTNDMPIAYPPSFETLGILPFNLNPHYLDPQPASTHMGETREDRIKEFHTINSIPVLGLREGSWLEVQGSNITLRGNLLARWFQSGKEPIELAPNTIFADLL